VSVEPERRQGERQHRPRLASVDTWLGAWGRLAEPGGRSPGGAAGAPGDADLESGSDSTFIAREAKRLVATEGAALQRILRTYIAARAALGLALVLAPWLAALIGGRTALPLMALCLVYAGQAVSMWLLHDPANDVRSSERLLPRQWFWTIGVDLMAFSLLRLLDPLAQLNYAALLVLPVLMSGVLTPRRVALATAAGVTLMLLLGVWLAAAEGGDLLLQLSQAGLAGAGMFLIALLANELAQRLTREERTARSSLELARQQTLLNRLVIEEMADGVLVVDRQGRVRAINPAARSLLGPVGQAMTLPCPLSDQPGLQVLQRTLDQAYGQGSWPVSAREMVLPLDDGGDRHLQVRARFTRRGGIAADDTPPEDICVLFLKDLRILQARARQDKLAAMGRMSAGIAHEIRNPLAAIAQANALLLEDALLPPHRQLARIVANNVHRLKRIVDDVLAVAPGTVTAVAAIDAVAELAQVCADWCHAAAPELHADECLRCDWPDAALWVLFDAEHLRRVLVNLLDNGARHASKQAGALQLRLALGQEPGTVRLTLASDGEAIQADVERHLFEPFFSTRSRGSGLGLYICRELCERYGASIDFGLAPATARHRNIFGVTLRAAPSP
jgi:two-component system sensor histidine kinase PilS (NtrC family)